MTSARGSSGRLGQSDSFIRFISANQIQNNKISPASFTHTSNQKSPRRELTKKNPISVEKHERMRPQVPTVVREPGALFLNYFYRIKAPTSIIVYLYEIGEPFPIEWCQELPPSDRSFGYRGLSIVISLMVVLVIAQVSIGSWLSF